jgi:ABC-type lipoprotein release transport system permease subunit
VAVVLALLLAVFGTWIPALWAARQDPATVLQEG